MTFPGSSLWKTLMSARINTCRESSIHSICFLLFIIYLAIYTHSRHMHIKIHISFEQQPLMIYPLERLLQGTKSYTIWMKSNLSLWQPHQSLQKISSERFFPPTDSLLTLEAAESFFSAVYSVHDGNGKNLPLPRSTLDTFQVPNSPHIWRAVLKGSSLCCMGEQMWAFVDFFSNLVHLQYKFHTALKSEKEVLQISFFPCCSCNSSDITQLL